MLPLEQARMAIQQGDKGKAKAILANLVTAEPQNAHAWLLLSEVLDNPQQASYCRERAQSILKNQNPNNINPNTASLQSAKSSDERNKRFQAKCPFCAELISSDAIVCPYCARNLSSQAIPVTNSPQRLQPKPVTSKPVNKQSSYGTNIFLAILIGICLVCGFIFLAGSLESASTPEVRYEIIGSTSSATITWMNSQGGLEQGDYNLPFRKTFSWAG